MGTPDFAVMPLKRLVEAGYNIVSVITTPDKPAGRGLKVQESAVKRYAVSVGLPVLQPEKLKAPEFVEAFRALDLDLAIVIAFRMLPEIIWHFQPPCLAFTSISWSRSDQLGHYQWRDSNRSHHIPVEPRNRQGGYFGSRDCCHSAGRQCWNTT